MTMKVIFLLMGYLYLRWTSVLACKMWSCRLDERQFENANNVVDMVKRCTHLNSTINCLHYNIETCEGNTEWTSYTQDFLVNTTILRDFVCFNKVLCSNVKFCTALVEKVNKTLENNKVSKACRYFQDVVRCMRMAEADCSHEKSISPAMSEQSKQTLRVYEDSIRANCSTAHGVQGEYMTGVSESDDNNMGLKKLSSWLILVVSLYLSCIYVLKFR